MKKRKHEASKSLLVMSVMVFYLLIASSHVFFLPRLTELRGAHSTAFNSVFKRKIETVRSSFNESSYVQRPDKSTLEEKKSATDWLTAVIGSFTLLFFVFQLWKLSPKPYVSALRLLIDRQYVYLFLCNFRI